MDAVSTSIPGEMPALACVNHPHVATSERCARCAQPFCGDCLVPILGQSLCANCKGLCVRDIQRQAAVPDRQAQDALMYSLVGMFLCVFLHPIAIMKGVQALQRHKGDSGWPDRWKAITAVALSSVMLTINLGYILLIVIYGVMGR